jgi:hypothetical protein
LLSVFFRRGHCLEGEADHIEPLLQAIYAEICKRLQHVDSRVVLSCNICQP